MDFSAHKSDCNQDSEVLDSLGHTGGLSGQAKTAFGAVNYLQVSAIEDLNLEQDALVSKSDQNNSQNEPHCNPKPRSAESLDSGIQCHSIDQCLHESAQRNVPSCSSEVLESSGEDSHGPSSISTDIINCKPKGKSVLLRHCSPDLTASWSHLVGQSSPADKHETCPPLLITTLSAKGPKTIAKEDEWSFSEAASIPTLFKIPSLSEIMPGSGKDLHVEESLCPVDYERTNQCGKGKGKQSMVIGSQSSSRNGELACVRIKSYPYSHRTLVTPVVLPLDSYKACLSAMGFLLPWTYSEVSGPKNPKNGLSKRLHSGAQPNHSMSSLLNHLDAIACHLIPNRSSTKNVLPLMRFHRTASKLKHHQHKDLSVSKWLPLNTSQVLQLPLPELKMDTWGSVERHEDSSIHSKQSGDLSPSTPPLLHLLSTAQPYQVPMSIVRKGSFSGAGLSTVVAMSSPASFRLWLRHIHPTFTFTSSSSSLVNTVKNQIIAQTSCSPLRPLADYTGPPGLDNDHR